MDPEDSPASRRRHKVRERILAAAEHVFAEEGAEGLSIRRLADRIDYSPAAIYKYYASKDALVNELKESFFALLLSRIKAIQEIPMLAGERARSCAALYIQTAVDKPHHYAAAFAGQSGEIGPSENDPGFEDTQKGQAFMLLQSIITQGISEGVFRAPFEPSLIAKSVWASLHGLAMMIIHIPSFPLLRAGMPGMTQAHFIAFHADQIVRGLEINP